MSIKVSTGLRNGALAVGSVKSLLDGGFIHIYANNAAAPASANDAVGAATLLTTISLASGVDGINFDTAAVNAVLSKAPGEAWSGVNVATGTAAWYRHVAAGDDGTSSTTQCRVQGDVGVAGAGLNLTSVNLTAGATQTIDYYSVAWPTL